MPRPAFTRTGGPKRLFVQQYPGHRSLGHFLCFRVGLHSAAGMTAIVTGRKTNNGVLSQSDAAVRGKTDGVVLKTILEYAEDHGLSTGVARTAQ